MGTEVQDIKDRLNIVDFIGEYVRLTKAGSNFKGLCPFHNEKSPSFMVSEERQSWHCFGCSKGGDIYTFLMEQEGMEFKEALRVLAERAGVELKRGTRDKGQVSGGGTKSLIEILEVATKFYEKQLWEGEGQKKALPYLRDRGITDESIRAFRLGYAPDGWDHVLKFLTSRGYSPQDIEFTGLLVKKDSSSRSTHYSPRKTDDGHVAQLQPTHSFYDRFRDRIMFPVTDALGRVIGYSARVLPGADEKHAKYVNTPESPAYHKSKVLYGISQAKQAIKEKDRAIVVEGNMDVIAMHQAGFPNTIAVSGTALTEEHIRIMSRYTKNIALFFDMDTAGQNAARKSAELGFRHGLNMNLVSLEEGKDAAELAKENPEKLQQAISGARDAFSHFLDRAVQAFGTDTPQNKKRVVEDMAPLIMSFESEVERSGWIHEVAEKIGIEEAAVSSEIERRREPVFRPRGEQRGEAPAVPHTTRLELLGEALLGLVLAQSIAWKEVSNILKEEGSEGVRGALESVGALEILNRGEACGYDFDALRENMEDPGKVRKLQQLVAKYGEDAFASDKDHDVGGEVKKIMEGIRSEWKKTQLTALAQELHLAEASGDAEKQEYLRQQFTQLTHSNL